MMITENHKAYRLYSAFTLWNYQRRVGQAPHPTQAVYILEADSSRQHLIKFSIFNDQFSIPLQDTVKSHSRQASVSIAANKAASSFRVKGCSRRVERVAWADSREARMSRVTAFWSGRAMGLPVSR